MKKAPLPKPLAREGLVLCVLFCGVDGEGFGSFEYESEISFGCEIMTRGHCEIFGVSPKVK